MCRRSGPPTAFARRAVERGPTSELSRLAPGALRPRALYGTWGRTRLPVLRLAGQPVSRRYRCTSILTLCSEAPSSVSWLA